MHYQVMMSQGIPAHSTVYIMHEEMKALEPLLIITIGIFNHIVWQYFIQCGSIV